MARVVFESGRVILDFARQLTLGLFEGFEGDAWVHQPFPGANHALWTLGHIVWTDDDLLEKLGPRPAVLPKEWHERFGMGSTPTHDRKAYPDPKALFEALSARRAELLAWFASMDEARLAASLPDDWKAFAPNYGALMPSMAWHEGFHAGQLSVIRKSLNMPRKFA